MFLYIIIIFNYFEMWRVVCWPLFVFLLFCVLDPLPVKNYHLLIFDSISMVETISMNRESATRSFICHCGQAFHFLRACCSFESIAVGSEARFRMGITKMA